LQSGGNEAQVPFYFIAHDPTDNSIVVAHEGTDVHELLSIANDAAFGLVPVNQTNFPGAPASAQVHQGFQETFQRTNDGVLAGVKAALASTGATKVAVTGHSLGAAIASMDTAMLRLALPKEITITAATFGLPRVGNQAWADFIDATIGGSGDTSVFAHVSNQHDPVPSVPPRFLGFQQVGGEIHIQDVDAETGEATSVVNCPGQDNANCAEGNDILQADVENHLGPYFDDLSFGGKQCAGGS
jgi:predicted lipase